MKSAFHVFTFKVSLSGKIYRIIEIKGSSTLYDLAEAILNSFNFDMDHLFGFFGEKLKGPFKGYVESYELFLEYVKNFGLEKTSKNVKKTLVSDVFQKRKNLEFRYDYGDEWRFKVSCTKEEEVIITNFKYPRVIKEVGQSPEQYPECHDYEEKDVF